MAGKLVSFETTRGLILDGMLCEAQGASGTVVHVHGSYGNFYQNPFVRILASVYTECGLNFLSFNLAAHDGIAEGYGRDEEFAYVGGAVVAFDTCVDDIAGAVRFAEATCERVVLQGHSLGCDRVLQYMLSTGDVREFVLLCPCDSYELHNQWLQMETVEQQRLRLGKSGRDGDGIKLVAGREYGLRRDDWTYEIPITRRALLSIVDGAPARLIRPGGSKAYYLDAACAVYLGGEDPLLTVDMEVMFRYFEERVRAVRRVYVKNGDHLLSKCAENVGRAVADWLSEGVSGATSGLCVR